MQLQLTPEGPWIIFLSHNLLQHAMSGLPKNWGLAPWVGRLAVFRWRFERAFRRPGMDPATFATELGILAVRGFGDMGKRARDAMIRDKFIAAQRHCGLHRHFDGFAPDTPIGEIVDSCRVWESHSDREPSSDDDWKLDSRRQSGDPRKLARGTGGFGIRLTKANVRGRS